MVRMLWKKDSKQLAERKDTIEMINMKCHDIRHKLEDYHLPITDDEEKELKSLIRIYDQTYRTGSQTLDVLLADRALLCEKDHIQLSFLGDGSCLKFLTEADVYSLLGNALGNAVEAARRVEEEKRQISMIIRNSGDLVSISVTNYFQGQLHFEEDLPVTTQPDAEDFHGYGMKSMQAIAEKYGGKLKVKAENGVFKLTIWLIDNSRQPT
ncbi:ATPase/histidine kinase/DNA gyrase B/HSP90 domain protein [Pseudoflavonifractor capillosus ATCC 29799]|uniref:ATPase/histidine kinase/DNA gyrase B/HSP90 domain protein n=2 Tax=Pseudoflavonifractor capillosus TaxID=106588 RepID=A6NTU8_9FIRM|nr:ATPase/histidine kinase/DNA gyrase B/HSP90 domain protein [Pseudoflavonifractor capillosus ATCC 29799]